MKITKKDMKEFLQKKLATDNKWAIRALEIIYSKQTVSEKERDNTIVHNNEGFSSYDAEILSSIAKQWQNKKFLTKKQLQILQKRIPRYWSQILSVSDNSKLILAFEKAHPQFNLFSKSNYE